jgi:hypothetical protein
MTKKNSDVLVIDAAVVPEELKMTVRDAQALRSEVLELREGIEKTYYRLGSKLKQVSIRTMDDGKPVWMSWGYQSFDEYCERELGFRERKAYYLLDVFGAVEKGAMTEADVERMGWTKAATLAPLVNKGIITRDNSEDWMKKIDGKTYNELREMSNTAKTKAAQVASDARTRAGQTGENVDEAISKAVGSIRAEDVSIPATPKEVIHMFRAGLPEPIWNVWQNALQKAKEITGSDKEPWLMECIAQAFLAECLTGREDLLNTLLSRIETAYEVKIFAASHDGTVEYCNPDIAELAKKVS